MSGAALITGGGGFLGSRLARLLHADGIETHILDTAPRDPDLPDGIRYHQGSILDRTLLDRLVRDKRLVFHMAAIAALWSRDPALYDLVNHHGAENLLAAVRAASNTVRLVVTSTALILRGWDDPDPGPVRIDDPKPPLSAMPGPYSRSKWRADDLVRRAIAEGLDAILLYPTVPLGTIGRHVTAPTEMVRQFLTNPPPAYLKTSLNLIDADDAARAHLLAARQAQAGERFLLAGDDIAFRDFLALLAELSGRPMPRRTIPYGVAALAAHGGERLARLTGHPPAASTEGVRSAKRGRLYDGEDIRRRLGWRPRPIRETLEEMVNALIG